MTYRLGLTGSIGMGKTTTAQMFADQGVPVWDADATVRRLYAPNGQGAQLVAQIYPDVIQDGAVSRTRLRRKIAANPAALADLEKRIHPLVAADRVAFLAATDAEIVVLDIPLLFETHAQDQCDGIVVVSAPADVQRKRVLARAEMTVAEFEVIRACQMPDAEKRRLATWVIETLTFDLARAAVLAIIVEIRQRIANA